MKTADCDSFKGLKKMNTTYTITVFYPCKKNKERNKVWSLCLGFGSFACQACFVTEHVLPLSFGTFHKQLGSEHPVPTLFPLKRVASRFGAGNRRRLCQYLRSACTYLKSGHTIPTITWQLHALIRSNKTREELRLMQLTKWVDWRSCGFPLKQHWKGYSFWLLHPGSPFWWTYAEEKVYQALF